MSNRRPETIFVKNAVNILVIRNYKLESEFAHDQLRKLASSTTEAHFILFVAPIFGADIDLNAYKRLYSELASNKLKPPVIKLYKSTDELDGHEAGYNRSEKHIGIYRGLVKEAFQSDDGCWKLLSALTEEYGHYIDDVLRNVYTKTGGDALNDEGAILAYDLIQLKFQQSQETAFATASIPSSTGPLFVDHTEYSTAITKWLSDEEQVKDDRNTLWEFFKDGINGYKSDHEDKTYGHRSIELILKQAGFTENELKQIYFGNWLRDYSQLVDPSIVRMSDDIAKDPYAVLIKQPLLNSINALEKAVSDPKNQQSVKDALTHVEQALKELDTKAILSGGTQQIRSLLAPIQESSAVDQALKKLGSAPNNKKFIANAIAELKAALGNSEAKARQQVATQLNIFEQAVENYDAQQTIDNVLNNARQLANDVKNSDLTQASLKQLDALLKKLDQKYGNDIDQSLNKKDLDQNAIKAAANPDFCSRLDESILLSRQAVTKIVDLMSIKEFGPSDMFRVTEKKLGVYRPEEHIDNPLPDGDPTYWSDVTDLDKTFAPLPTMETLHPPVQMQLTYAAKATDITLDSVLIEKIANSPENIVIVLEGHTDNRGSEEANKTLSEQRASTLKQRLIQEFGPSFENKIKTVGVGETQPITSNETEAGRIKNRRVNITIKVLPQLGVNPATGLKNYINTPTANQSFPTAVEYMSKQFQQAVIEGKAGKGNPDDPRTTEGMRHLGQGLHVLEDFFAHSNFVELSLIKIGKDQVIPWVDAGTAINGRLPVVTGRFGQLDVIASIGPKIADALFPVKVKDLEFHEPGHRTPQQIAALTVLEDLADAQKQCGKEDAKTYFIMYKELLATQDAIYEVTKKFSDTTTSAFHNFKRIIVTINTPFNYLLNTLASNIDDIQTVTGDLGSNPTHSQLAKDHSHHPLHDLAAELAQVAVLNVGIAIKNAWKGKSENADPVAIAQSYIIHPMDTEWMSDIVNDWATRNPQKLSESYTATWVDGAHEHYKELSKGIQETQKDIQRILKFYHMLVTSADNTK